MATETRAGGSAAIQGPLWSARARDWAELIEPAARPLYEIVLRAAGVGPGKSLLDVGCASGIAATIAAQMGATVAGIDAAPALIALARERLPSGDFRVADMEALPFADTAFDVVTGFSTFQFAASPANALREARRVTRAGGVVAIVLPRPEASDTTGLMKALQPLLPPPPPGAPGPLALSDETLVLNLARDAGLAPGESADVRHALEWADLDRALRALLSTGPLVMATRVAGEARVSEAVAQFLATHRTAEGQYRLDNTFRYLICAA